MSIKILICIRFLGSSHCEIRNENTRALFIAHCGWGRQSMFLNAHRWATKEGPGICLCSIFPELAAEFPSEFNSTVQTERADIRSRSGPRGEVKQKQSLNSGLQGGRLGHNCLLRGLVSGAGRNGGWGLQQAGRPEGSPGTQASGGIAVINTFDYETQFPQELRELLHTLLLFIS